MMGGHARLLDVMCGLLLYKDDIVEAASRSLTLQVVKNAAWLHCSSLEGSYLSLERVTAAPLLRTCDSAVADLADIQSAPPSCAAGPTPYSLSGTLCPCRCRQSPLLQRTP